MTSRAPIAVALDAPDLDTAAHWADLVTPHVSTLKVGLELYLRFGPEAGASVGGPRARPCPSRGAPARRGEPRPGQGRDAAGGPEIRCRPARDRAADYRRSRPRRCRGRARNRPPPPPASGGVISLIDAPEPAAAMWVKVAYRAASPATPRTIVSRSARPLTITLSTRTDSQRDYGRIVTR